MWRRGVSISARRRGKQLLLEPYVKPLTEKGKRIGRKTDTAHALAQYPHLRGDIYKTVNTSVVLRPAAAKEQRETLHRHLAALVKAEFGPQFDVTDISMHTYSLNLPGSVFEFRVVAPEGEAGPDHQSLAELLAKHDLANGVFNSHSSVTLNTKGKARQPSVEEAPTRQVLGYLHTTHAMHPAYPEHQPPVSAEPVCPIELQDLAPKLFALSFTLSPAHPRHQRMDDLRLDRRPGASTRDAVGVYSKRVRTAHSLYSVTPGLLLASRTSDSWMTFVRTVHSTVLSINQLEDSALIQPDRVERASLSQVLLDDPGFIIPDEPLLHEPTVETTSELEKPLFDMSRELWQYYESRRPTPQVLAARTATIRSINDALNKFAAKHGNSRAKSVKYKVLPFGSSLTGADELNSDLDLVLADPLYPDGWRPDIKHDKLPTCMYDVRKLSKFLWKFGFTNLVPIPNARVPIVSGTSRTDPPISFDLNINRRNGLFNSSLLAAYAEVHPHFRPLLVILKAWSRAVGLDAPAVTIKMGRRTFGTVRPFSSYIMGTLLVAYMQHVKMLPNLQEPFVVPITSALEPAPLAESEYKTQRRPEASAATMDHIWWDIGTKGSDIRIPYDTRFLDPKSKQVQQWLKKRQRKGVPEPTLADTLHGFFTFYGRQFNYAFEAVSVRDGGIVPRRKMPGYRAPERFFNELQNDLICGEHLSKSRTESLLTPKLLREGDSLEVDLEIEREAASLLDMPTDTEQFRAAVLVIIDPIFRQNNLGRVASRGHVMTFVSECARAESVFELNLDFKALLTRKPKVRKGKKGEQ